MVSRTSQRGLAPERVSHSMQRQLAGDHVDYGCLTFRCKASRTTTAAVKSAEMHGKPQLSPAALRFAGEVDDAHAPLKLDIRRSIVGLGDVGSRLFTVVPVRR
jgi:hypothetical protein